MIVRADRAEDLPDRPIHFLGGAAAQWHRSIAEMPDLSATASTGMSAKFQNAQNSGSHRFRIGEFECAAIWDGCLIRPYQGIYPNAGPGELEALRSENLLHPDQIPMDLNVLAVNTGKELLVVDSGMGETVKMSGAGMGHTRANMRAAGIDPG